MKRFFVVATVLGLVFCLTLTGCKAKSGKAAKQSAKSEAMVQ